MLLQDYRDLEGQYDKLVSIEMVEAVGAPFLDGYFAHCSRLLKPEGAMLLQAITIQDQYYEAGAEVGGFHPALRIPRQLHPVGAGAVEVLAKVTDFKIFHLEDIGPHYARTLRLWRERFFRNLAAVRELGYSDSFVRLWEYYLCYCEGGFMERQLGTVQMLLTKPGCRRALPGRMPDPTQYRVASGIRREIADRALSCARERSRPFTARPARARSTTPRCSPIPSASRRCCAIIARCIAATRWPWSRRRTPRRCRACSRSATSIASAWCPRAAIPATAAAPRPDASSSQVLLSLARLNRVRAIDADNYTMIAEAGCVLANLQAAAAEADRYLPLSLGSEGSCMLGGNLSTNAGGLNVIHYGMARELVLGLEVVLADGRVMDTLTGLRKDNTGYDIKSLFLGAEGTLGVITAACIKLYPGDAGRAPPRSSRCAIPTPPCPC